MRTKLPLITAILVVFAITKGGAVRAEDAVDIIILQTRGTQEVQSLEADESVLAVNIATMDNSLSGVVDVTMMDSVAAWQVKKLIEENYIADRAIYLDGVTRQEGDLDYVIARRNLSAITDPVSLRYGVLTKNTAVRAYPTWQKLSDSAGDQSMDYFQKSMFMIGEGVVVLHQTEDLVWSFVQGENETGWVETNSIAFCQKEEMKTFANAVQFIVVTDDELVVGNDELRMGTRLPLSGIEEDYAVVRIPESNDDGNLYQMEMKIPLESGIHIGYLPLNEETLSVQAMKLLGFPYGWGDADGFMDAASTVISVYRCSGILLPRTVSRMKYAGLYVTDLGAMSLNEKREFILGCKAGSILLTEDQAALYMGVTENGTPMIIHNVMQYSSDGVTVTDAYRCISTPLDIFSPDGTNYLEEYRYLIEF